MLKNIVLIFLCIAANGNAMAYNIHITAADGWWESESNPISLHQLKEYVSHAHDLREESSPGATNPVTGEVIRIPDEYTFTWKSDDNVYWFHFNKGRITFRYTDDIQISKAKEIAKALNAKVQGDEEELY